MPKTIADMLESGENVIGVWVKYYRLFKTICGKVTKDFGDGTVLIDGEDSSGPSGK